MCEREFDAYDAVGYASGILFPSALVPQVYKSFKTKELDDLSYGWQFVFMSGLVGSIVYGVHRDLKPIYLSSMAEFVLMSSLIIMKYIHTPEKNVAQVESVTTEP
jgi:MtN3 and saliva related transmembrane protein